MSQVIPTPDNIVTKVVNQGNIAEDAVLLEVVKGQIKDYTKEVALVAIILSDNYMKRLYESYGNNYGYIACLDEIHQWAVEYVNKFAHVEEWEEFLETDRTYGECVCWDDHCIAFGETKIVTYETYSPKNI